MESVDYYISLLQQDEYAIQDVPEEVQIAHPEISLEAVKQWRRSY